MNIPAHDTKILFVRHGESLKNIQGIHGGSGQCLTEKGILECNSVISKIQTYELNNKRTIIIGHNSKQVVETMNIFSLILNCPSIFDERIHGIHLGVANGVSRKDLKILFPNDALMLDQWRARKISIKDLKVTNMEVVDDFYYRINDFIHSCKKNKDFNTFIVVCTTSIMIMIINIIALGANFNFKSYYHYNVNTGDYVFANIKTDLTIELIETSINLDSQTYNNQTYIQ